MARGAYSVHVNIETANGSSRVIVPVNSLATTRLPMSPALGTILAALGVMLFLLAVTIVSAGVRESVLQPGQEPDPHRRWWGRGAAVGAFVLLGLALYAGRSWWNAEDRDYRNNKMHQPVDCDVKVRIADGQRIAQLTILTNETRAAWPGLVPDHGKLMHVFLVREPQLDVLAHVHPVRRTHRLFEVALPPVPAGDYRLYADVTHENGLSQTLTALTTIPESPAPSLATDDAMTPDPDDSWFQGAPLAASQPRPLEASLGDGRVMTWERPERLTTGRETALRFAIREADGKLTKLDPYMGMLGHVAIRRQDGAVFTHLHPAGSLSIAAQQVAWLRAGENPPRRITPEMMEALCQPPDANQPQQPITFPWEFPKPGLHRIWVQVKIADSVRTAAFDCDVAGK